MPRAKLTLRERGQEALRKNNFEYAVRLYLEHLRRNPGDVEAREELRAAEVQQAKSKGRSPVGSVFRRFFSLPSLTLIGFLKLFGRHRAIMARCERLLVKNPSDFMLNATLAAAADGAGHAEVAVFSYRLALERDPENAALLRSLARAYRGVEKIAEAIEIYQRLLRVEPSDDEARTAVRDLSAQKSLREGWSGEEEATAARAEKAIESAPEELVGEPEDKETALEAADRLAGRQEYGKAASMLQRFAAKHGEDLDVRTMLGEMKLRQYDVEVAELEQKASAGNKDAEEKLKRVRKARNSLAIGECVKKIQRYPTDMGLKLRLGELYYEADQIDKAIPEFQRAVRSGRHAGRAHEMMGLCFVRKRIYDLAAEQFKKALAASRGSEPGETAKRLNYWLGRTYELMNDRKAARSFYARVYEADINYRDVAEKMEALPAEDRGEEADSRTEEN